jgi:mono/diheme cytochrome c family protein
VLAAHGLTATAAGSGCIIPFAMAAARLALFVLLALATAVVIARSPAAQTSQPKTVTYTEHVAPIIFKNCVTCHRPGQSAPFSLLTYEDAKTNGFEIADAVRTHFMPPWKPAPTDYAFKDDRHLSNGDIDTLQRWVKGGMPKGDPSVMPPLPAFSDQPWPLGPPDLILTLPEAFTVPADGRDIYRNFVLPLNFRVNRWIKAVDIRPTARPVVHHVNFLMDPTGAARAMDEADPGPGFGGVMGPTGLRKRTPRDLIASLQKGEPIMPANEQSTVFVGTSLPGASPHRLPDDLAYFVPANSDLIVTIHFHVNGQQMTEQSSIGIYFAGRPPSRPFAAIQLPVMVGAFEGINIPPGDKSYTISDSFVVPMDLKAFAVGAHAHYIGKDVTLTARFPGGPTRTLLHIPDWDLNFQGQYYFEEYVRLPKGTKLEATIRYDNSAGNPHNPFSPPQRILFGEQSTNEMGAVTLQVIGDSSPMLAPLHQAYQEHVRQSALASPLARGRGR